FYDELYEEEGCQLLEEIENINFSVLENIQTTAVKEKVKIRPVQAVTLQDVKRRRLQYEEVGLRALENKKVGAVLFAGGQGTRLGFDKAKGLYNIGETRFLSIFEQLMNNIQEVTSVTGRYFPLFIMTNSLNNGETVEFFKDNNYFGYPRDRVHFFIQNTEPACDFDGKIFLDQKNKISLSPNGNGGWYSSLINAGFNRIIEREKIEWLNVFGVDNVLQRICDPVFIGATLMSGHNCGAKVVKKLYPEEKVGVLCEENGKPAIVEYYEMPPELATKKDRSGELVYRYGVTLNYLFNVKQLNTTLSGNLPYHLAKKAVPYMENGLRIIPDEPNGYKFETLVVDMVKLMGSCLAFEVDRDNEFAPVKNAHGADSVDTARLLLKKNGVIL
ncbi:MAG: UTP--glucose-1-phosphate uridylyltransferase, partial [Clostridia bacterium]|nr:UTP--glucose-1-phosphate uridylyltransferase [Clostridia bacterium]